MRSCALLLFILTFSSFARTELPEVHPPKELSRQGSEFTEGTLTRLSKEDVAQFLPYAQNARAMLTKAIAAIESMKLKDKTLHLEKVIRSVVQNSGQKSYQTYMRYALNRTLLLVQEMRSLSNIDTVGVEENILDFERKGIEVALNYYQSDLDFQQRNDSNVIASSGIFGLTLAKSYLSATQNVFNSKAQYRLLYKTLEILNWDLSRDQLAPEVSEHIMNIYNALSGLDEMPSAEASENLTNIRKLNLLVALVPKIEGDLTGAYNSKNFTLIGSEKYRLKSQVQQSEVFILNNDLILLPKGTKEEVKASCMKNVSGGGFFTAATDDNELTINEYKFKYYIPPAGTPDYYLIMYCNTQFSKPEEKATCMKNDYSDRPYGWRDLDKKTLCEMVSDLKPYQYKGTNKEVTNVTITVGKQTLSYSGTSSADLLFECFYAYQNLKDKEISEIKLLVNGQPTNVKKIIAEDYKSAAKFCSDVTWWARWKRVMGILYE